MTLRRLFVFGRQPLLGRWQPSSALRRASAFFGKAFLFMLVLAPSIFEVEFYCLFDVSRRKTNSCRTLMAAVVPRAIPAFSKVS